VRSYGRRTAATGSRQDAGPLDPQLPVIPPAQADRVKLLENHEEAWRARVALITGAPKTIEMECYAVHPGYVRRKQRDAGRFRVLGGLDRGDGQG
jgi:phosphatidylserine/phosphatidylglycerophosphate/cardiolipin synthase-like enzyme